MTERLGTATELARRVARMQLSPTVAMAQKAAAVRATGRTIVDLTVGEPDRPTPAHIVEAAVLALSQGKTRYAPSAGLPELRAAVALRYRRDAKVSFAEQEVGITSGGKHALYLACQALLDRGDEVIIPTPHWPSFSECVRLAGARPILIQTSEKDAFQVTARMISKATSPRTRAVILNSPCNPTGATIEAEDLLVIGDMAQRRKFTLLFDDAYGRLLYKKTEPGVMQALRDSVGDRLVILGTASKTYCMTGWRIGWVLGPRLLVDACARLVSHSTQCPTTFAQVAAVQALVGSQRSVADMVGEYKQRREVVMQALAGIPKVSCVSPSGAFYAFPNVARWLCPQAPSTLALAQRLLEEKGVAVVPGEAFDAPGHLRLSFARPTHELTMALDRLRELLESLPA